MNKDIINRIKDLMSYYQLSQSDFAKQIGVRQPNISAILKGERPCGSGVLNKILLSFDIDRAWLLTGEGSMLKNGFAVDLDESAIKIASESDDTKKSAPRQSTGFNDYKVPLIPTAALANSLSEYLGPGIRKADCQSIISPVPGAEFAITISGDSMEPKFHDGMVVFLKKINDAAFIPWGNTMVLDTENGAFIKDVFPIAGDDSSIEARSLNPLYPPLLIPKTSIYGMYRVLNATKFFTTM